MDDATQDLTSLLSERPDVEIGGGSDGYDTPVEPPSPNALRLDDWSLRRGSEMFYESELIQGAFKEMGLPENPADDDWRHTGEYDTIVQAERATQDFHAAAFEPSPELAKNPKDQRISRYMKNLMETPEFQQLHDETKLDEHASEVAAAHFAKQYAVIASKPEPADEWDKDMEALSAASQALAGATEEVDEMRDAEAAMGGMGAGNGAGGAKLPKEELRKRFQRIRNSHTLARICQLAGRYRRMAAAMQRKKVLHGQDDIVGVTLGDNVSSLVPSELAQLADEDLELDAMRRIVEACAMVRDHRGVEKVAKGPIVVVVDESGSMDGEPICQAKAYALAMYWIARHQRRWCCLVGFSGSEEGNFLVIRPEEDKSVELMDWLEHFFGGGTDMDVPLKELPRRWHEQGTPPGRTDIINITDAICRVPEKMGQQFNEWKARVDARYNIILVGESDGGPLKSVADRIWTADTIDVGEAAVAESFASV